MAKDIKNYSDDSQKNVNGTLNNDSKAEQEVSLDALLYDSGEESTLKETPEETAEYEAFFAEYKDIMAKTLSAVKASSQDVEEQQAETEIDSALSSPVENDKKKSAKDNEKWDEEITLAPEKYEDLSDEAEIFDDTVEESEPDFNLGQNTEKKSDKFQISFAFDGNEIKNPVEENTREEEEKYDPDKPRIIDWAFDFVELFVFTLIAVMILTTFVFKHSVVDGDSMNGTLNHGEHLIISDLFYTPERGDIVVFEDYSTNLNKAVVKRVVGLPGETVKITINENGKLNVYIDGELLEEDYVYYDRNYFYGVTGEWTVPENEIFVMGDNRYNSKDSRDSGVGTISIDSILGKVLFRFAPLDKFGKVE